MPKRFTPEQFAASAAAGEPRIKQSFAGDTYAWHTYQDSYFRTLFGELTDASRADRWKKACRQREAIENQRTKAAADNVALVADENHDAPNQVHKRLKVSARWQAEHAAAILELDASAPHASPNGKHATRQLRAVVATPGGVNTRECCAEVCYDLPPAEGESKEAAKQRVDRHRSREQLALQRLAGAAEKEETARREEEAAEAARRAEEEARLQRMTSVVRDDRVPLPVLVVVACGM